MRNHWRMQDGGYVYRWDDADMIEIQPKSGPANRIMSSLMERIDRLGPQVLTAEEEGEIRRVLDNAHTIGCHPHKSQNNH